MPKISVIMLTFNRENLVSRAIESVLTQTFRDFELIVVDNGSTDNSGTVADEYAAKDSRIHVIHRSRGNIGAGRNTGLDAACGDWITFCDDDDYLERDYLEFLYDLALENSADIAICGRSTKFYDCKLLMDCESAICECLSRKYYTVGLPAKLIRKELFHNLRFSETAQYDDIGLTPYLFTHANRIIYHGLSKYVVNRDDRNHSSWTQNHALLDTATLTEYLCAYRKRTEFLCEAFPNNAARWRYFEWSFQISMVDKIYQYDIAACKEHLVKMLDDLRTHYSEFRESPWIQSFEKDWLKKYVTDPDEVDIQCG